MPIIPVLEGSKQKNQEESSSVQGTYWVGDQHGLPETLPQKQMKLVGMRQCCNGVCLLCSFIFNYLFYLYACFVCMYACAPEEAVIGSYSYELPCECWESIQVL